MAKMVNAKGCRRFRRHHRRNPPLLGFFDPYKFLTFVPTLEKIPRVRLVVHGTNLINLIKFADYVESNIRKFILEQRKENRKIGEIEIL
jgi:hypothetical protein